MDLMTIEEEERLTRALYHQVSYDRRQAAYMIDALIDQLGNSHLTVDYKIQLSRRVTSARRKWYREFFLNLESLPLLELLRFAAKTRSWSQMLSELFVTNARMIRDRLSRIRELNYNRHRQWCL